MPQATSYASGVVASRSAYPRAHSHIMSRSISAPCSKQLPSGRTGRTHRLGPPTCGASLSLNVARGFLSRGRFLRLAACHARAPGPIAESQGKLRPMGVAEVPLQPASPATASRTRAFSVVHRLPAWPMPLRKRCLAGRTLRFVGVAVVCVCARASQATASCRRRKRPVPIGPGQKRA